MSTESAPIPKWQIIVGWVLSCLPLPPFLMSAAMKIAQPGNFLEDWTKTYPAATARPLGLIELACVVLYFIPKTRILGAILVTGYLGGAIATHVAKGEPAAAVPFLFGVLLWGGIFLRMPQLRKLLPLVE
jgi:DoxX-like family